jgi:hypothetical protein
MATQTEKRIRHEQRRKGILLPLLEDLFQKPVEIETDEDIEFITLTMIQMMNRQQDRTSQPVFSPSQLAECLRYVYLLKNHKEYGLVKVPGNRIEPNFYFFTGNWLHLKWQFALWKLNQVTDDEVFRLIGVEVPIVSKHKDHGGTVDALCLVYNEPVIVDFKGLNVRTFSEITRGYIPAQYIIQLADYGMLYNAQSTKYNVGHKITRALLLTESKGGPDNKHPLALHESEISIQTHLPEVRSRLEELRTHSEQGSIPKPECTSTTSYQFQGCPFRVFCRDEVKRIERRRKRKEKAEGNLEVASPRRKRAS